MIFSSDKIYKSIELASSFNGKIIKSDKFSNLKFEFEKEENAEEFRNRIRNLVFCIVEENSYPVVTVKLFE